jgi:peptide/nickel transport system permease protein
VLRDIALRIGSAIVTLWLVTAVVFALIHQLPGGPFAGDAEDSGTRGYSAESLEQLRTLYRLDQPLAVQYGSWLWDVARGDLGRSFGDRRPVAERIRERAGITLALNFMALVGTLLVAVPLGMFAARHPGGRLDRWSASLGYALYALPIFWAALMLQLWLAVGWGWLPLAGVRSPSFESLSLVERTLDLGRHLLLPAICLAYGSVAYVARFLRGTLLDSALPDVWRAARARGLSTRAVMWRHALRHAGIPLLTLAGFMIPALFSGSVIVERVFAIPGLGGLFLDAAHRRDAPVLMALTLLAGAATLLGILLADLSYRFVDPRVRRG